MGVKDLWKLLEPTGRPVKLETLEGLVLGVDVSIWLNQAVKGVRDRHGETVPHAHLIVLFNRICKLLHYHIKPVFVFDGATPLLKQQTLSSRRKRKEIASQRSLRAADRQASKVLQAKILEHLTGEKSSIKITSTWEGQTDMFHLPPISEGALSKEKSPTFDESFVNTQLANNQYYSDVASVNVLSKEFDDLPPEVQHEILLERQQIEKYSYHDPDTLPQVANDFSNYQLSRLMKRSRISQKLDGVRKVLKSNDTAVVGLGEESKVHEVETSRIMSSEAAHYILVKGMDIESQSSQDEEGEGEETDSQTSSVDNPVTKRDTCAVGGEIVNSAASRGERVLESVDVSLQKYGSRPEGALVNQESGVLVSDWQAAVVCDERTVDRDEPPSGGGFMLESSIEEDDEVNLVVAKKHTADKHEPYGGGGVVELESDTEESTCMKSDLDDTLVGEEVIPGERANNDLSVAEIEVGKSEKEDDALVRDLTGRNDHQAAFELPSGSTFFDTVHITSHDKAAKDDIPLPNFPSHNSGIKGEIEHSILLTTKETRSNEESAASKTAEGNQLPPLDLQTEEERRPTLAAANIDQVTSREQLKLHSSANAIDFTTTHTSTAEQGARREFSAPTCPAATTTVIDLSSTQTTTEPEVAVIESDEGSPPSPVTMWSDSDREEEGVEALLSVEPSEAQEQLGKEVEELERERTRQSRAAASVSNQMYKEAQELLSLFGLPYLIAPTEAEAQCATLNEQELTQGTITDDNDVFLFGGKKVYRHFFSQDKEVEVYTSTELQQRLGLSRDHLIVLAYLLGSDYTEGLEGIGIVMAMEFLRDFPGSGLEPLVRLREWHSQVANKPAIVKTGSALQKKLCQYPLPPGFPNTAVRESYLQPEVDDSSEQFEWGKPDLDLLRRFALEKMRWNQDKVDDILLPVLKRMNMRESQTQKKITQFLAPAPILTSLPTKQKRAIKSKRIRNVVARLTTEEEDHTPKKGRTNRTRGTSTSKRKQPVAKRRRKNSGNSSDSKSTMAAHNSPPSRQTNLPITSMSGANISASSSSSSSNSSRSSSSEDEFDRLVKDWEDDTMAEKQVKEVSACGGRKRTRK